MVWPVWWSMWYCPPAWVSCRVAPPVMGVRVDWPEASVKKTTAWVHGQVGVYGEARGEVCHRGRGLQD